MNQVDFESVIPSEEQIVRLFELLEQRLHRISCEEVDFSKHEYFVKSHPYRDWFLIRFNNSYIGSFYVSNENTIGINLSDEYTSIVVPCIIRFVKRNYKPLPAIPSVRSGNFAINVPPTNVYLASALEAADAKIAQITYFLPS